MALFKKWFGRKKKGESDDGSSAQEPALQPDEGASEPESPVATEEPALTTEAPPAPDPGPDATPAMALTPEPAPESEPAPEARPEKKISAWARLKQGLTKTRRGLTGLFFGRELDEDFVDELEAELYAADFGPQTVAELLDGENGIRTAWKSKEIEDVNAVRDFLKTRLREILHEKDTRLVESDEKPTVILVAGVNGTGKTTSIAKLSKLLQSHDKKVVLAAADTFRAAAVEQLTIWSERLGIEIVTGDAQADPASVAFRAAEVARESGADYLIVDTAGRLHTQKNLMKELEKIRNVLSRQIPDAPHECLLVLDATTGQNALTQAESFLAAIQVSGIILTKLDGTAKGGIVVTINNHHRIPVKFVGVGEGIDDLQHFEPTSFVEALLEAE